MPDPTDYERTEAMIADCRSLIQYRHDLDQLRLGRKVENLTIEGAKKAIDGLRSCIAEKLDDLDAPQCLIVLARITDAHSYLYRAMRWAGEVAEESAYEGISAAAWEEMATRELQEAVFQLMHLHEAEQ